MSTFDYIVNHALKNVWCTPEQDRQVILAPARISPFTGVVNQMRILWTQYPLPTSKEWYHVFQIGEITPELLGLLSTYNQWLSLDKHCQQSDLLVNVYLKNGVEFPRHTSYILRTMDDNVILAVKDHPSIGDAGNNPVYLRVYSNAYFQRSTDTGEGIEVHGATLRTTADLTNMQSRWQAAKNRKGHCVAYVNGRRVQNLSPQTMTVGNVVEFFRDSSIREIVEFKVSELPSFLSTLDRQQKYLLHPRGYDRGTIDYLDDLDFYLIKRRSDHLLDGVYYHKNAENAVRMVTHRDYSIPVDFVAAYVDDHPDWYDINTLSVQVYVRDSGYERELVDEHHRIKELYRLEDDEILEAMVGQDSTVDVWQAANLEASAYPALMRAPMGTIDHDTVRDAYGYNAISKLLADTPLKIDPVSKGVDLPVGLWEDSTIYEYRADGTLINWHYHAKGSYYPARSDECAMIEGVVGRGGQRLDTVYGQQEQDVNPDASYRFYIKDVFFDEPVGEWRDVTGSEMYEISDGRIYWNSSPSATFTMVRSNLSFLAYDLNLSYQDQLLRFTVNAVELRQNGELLNDRVDVPFGQFDLWLNGHPLIENLDYFAQWPEVVIVNKLHYKPELDAQRVSIRALGFCNQDLSRPEPAEFGFVQHGLLSVNGRYDVRDDKVVRIVGDGKLLDRSALNFSENDSGVRTSVLRNGAPYQITHPVIPLRTFSSEETYRLREKSLEVDRQVANYLSTKLPEPELPVPNPISGLYPIHSPFVCKIMNDMKNGFLDMRNYQGHYTDVQVRNELTEYEWLLDFEPTRKDIDFRYVSVHPHNLMTEVTLNVYQYRFLLRVIRIYLNDKVDITRFIRIESGFEHETPDHKHPNLNG